MSLKNVRILTVSILTNFISREVKMINYFQDDILAIVNLIRHKINESEKLKVVQKEISRRQAAVIGIIDESQGKPVFQKDISRILKIRRSTATSMLQDMEKDGLIERVPVGNDMRLKQLLLTEKANKYAIMIREEFTMIENLLIRGFDEEEKEQFGKFLERIKDNLAK